MPMVVEFTEVLRKVKTLDDGTQIDVTPKNPVVYLILMKNFEEEKTWESFVGNVEGESAPEYGNGYYHDMNGELRSVREVVFEYLINAIEQNSISLAESYVMTQNQTMKDNVSVYSFLRMCLDSDIVIQKKSEITYEDLNEYLSGEGLIGDYVYTDDGFEIG